MVVDRTMYISGQLGMDTGSGQLVAGGVQAQAKQVRKIPMSSYRNSICRVSLSSEETWLYINIYRHKPSTLLGKKNYLFMFMYLVVQSCGAVVQ